MRRNVNVDQASSYIGKRVAKKSNRPFQSGSKINTVKGVTVNPHTSKTAFSFEEDESVVDAHICSVVDDG